MLTQEQFASKIEENSGLLVTKFYLSLNSAVQNTLETTLVDPKTPIPTVHQIFKDFGYRGSLSAIRYFFYALHGIEPKKNRVKQRPMKVDTFRKTISPEEDSQLMEIVEGFNTRIEDIKTYLESLGFDGSWNCIRNWYIAIKKEGEQAQIINQALTKYEGIDYQGVIYKLLGDSIQQMDQLMTIVRDEPDDDFTASTAVKILPAISREIRSSIELIRRQTNASTALGLEKSGAAYVVEKLLATFAEEPHILLPLQTACEGILKELDSRRM